jgi:hypothetical protein
MQRAAGIIERCFIGHDPTRLYLRLDLRQPLDHFDALVYVSSPVSTTPNQRVDATFSDPNLVPRDLAAAWLIRHDAGQASPFLFAAEGHSRWRAVGPVTSASGEKVLELELPLATLGLQLGDELQAFVVLASDGQVLASIPARKVAVIPLLAF